MNQWFVACEKRFAADTRIDFHTLHIRAVPAHPFFNRSATMLIVKAHVQFCSGHCGNDVAGGVAHIDRGDFQIAWRKMLRSVIQRCRFQRMQQGDQPRDGVIRQFRIGHMPLLAAHCNGESDAAAPANFYHIAKLLWVGGFAYHTHIQPLAFFLQPAQQFFCAVNGSPLFILRDEQRDRAIEALTRLALLADLSQWERGRVRVTRAEKLACGHHKSGYRAFHIFSATAH